MADTPLPSLQEISSCVTGYDPAALPVAQAQAFIDRLVPRLQATEVVPLRSALGTTSVACRRGTRRSIKACACATGSAAGS